MKTPRVKIDDTPTRKKGTTRRPRLWHQLKNEPANSYQLFLEYRDLPATERSVRRVAELRNLNIRGVQALATAHKWTKRTNAYIRYLAWRREKIRIREITKMERQEVRLGRRMMNKSTASLKKLPAGRVDAHGVVALAKAGSELRRKGLGLPKEPKVEVNVGVAVQTNVISGLVAKLDQADSEMKSGALLEA